jgi:hypothetical protein
MQYTDLLWYHNYSTSFKPIPVLSDADIRKFGYEKCLSYRSDDAIKRDISYQALYEFKWIS